MKPGRNVVGLVDQAALGARGPRYLSLLADRLGPIARVDHVFSQEQADQCLEFQRI